MKCLHLKKRHLLEPRYLRTCTRATISANMCMGAFCFHINKTRDILINTIESNVMSEAADYWNAINQKVLTTRSGRIVRPILSQCDILQIFAQDADRDSDSDYKQSSNESSDSDGTEDSSASGSDSSESEDSSASGSEEESEELSASGSEVSSASGSEDSETFDNRGRSNSIKVAEKRKLPSTKSQHGRCRMKE